MIAQRWKHLWYLAWAPALEANRYRYRINNKDITTATAITHEPSTDEGKTPVHVLEHFANPLRVHGVNQT